ncbi:TonB-dependent receptor [Aurantiacibacter zhengii]|uniref:TonB-dependent receptor n=1 Tax=Aurantiacibacter zhengii TaxID=2307003 RepID=A0A418NS87_9SPHN|nr:TonB-dependent receptor [Aurantiacibacter zhengii]RIV85837.1 TonB-dependent receptor [Aurantiacibacter zhengii]
MIRALATFFAVSTASQAIAQGQAPATNAGESRCLDEARCDRSILVTARRQVEQAQDAGIAATILTGETLTDFGVTDPRDLTRLVPSLTVQPVDISTSFSIRGVGALAINAFQENAVAYNVDGIYFARPSAPAGTLFDIERIEVLRGPQGTLYGRNATAGAVNVVSRMPVLGETSANLLAELGTYDTRKLQGGASVPLGERAAIRLAGQWSRHDGYLSDGYDDENIVAARANLLLAPAENVELILSADYARIGGRGKGAVLFPSDRTPDAPDPDRFIGASAPRITQILQDRSFSLFRANPSLAALSDEQIRNLVSVPLDDGFQRSEFWGLSARMRLDLSFGELNTAAGYRRSSPDLLTYNPGFPSRIDETSDQFTAEISLVGAASERLDYIVGAYYFADDTDSFNNYDQGALANPEYRPRLQTESVAGFVSLTWHLSPAVRLLTGGRLTYETKSLEGAVGNRTVFNPTAPLVPIAGRRQADRLTWNVGAEWDVARSTLLYGSVATGFKSGGFFPSAGQNQYAPETLIAFTLGTKSAFLDDRITLNIEAFHWRYRDQQISYIGPVEVTPGNFGQAGVTVNAGSARMSGAQAELAWFPLPNTELRADVQYLEAEYGSLEYDAISAGGAPLLTTCDVTDDPREAAPPIRLFRVNCSGKPGLNAPRWTANFAVRQAIDLGNAYTLVVAANSRVESGSFINLDYLADQRRNAHSITGASIELTRRGAPWSVRAYVDNIEDTAVISAGLTRPIINVSLLSVRPPRTAGIQLRLKFGE